MKVSKEEVCTCFICNCAHFIGNGVSFLSVHKLFCKASERLETTARDLRLAFTAMKFPALVFWIVTPCSVVGGHQRLSVSTPLLPEPLTQHDTEPVPSTSSSDTLPPSSVPVFQVGILSREFCKNSACISYLPIQAIYTAYLSLVGLTVFRTRGDPYKSASSSVCRPHHKLLIYSNIFQGSLFSETCNFVFFFTPEVSGDVSDP
jgi:hypothetical protein